MLPNKTIVYSYLFYVFDHTQCLKLIMDKMDEMKLRKDGMWGKKRMKLRRPRKLRFVLISMFLVC